VLSVVGGCGGGGDGDAVIDKKGIL